MRSLEGPVRTGASKKTAHQLGAGGLNFSRRLASINRPAPGRPFPQSAVVGGFAVRGDVQTFALMLFAHTQTNRQVNNLVGDERHHA